LQCELSALFPKSKNAEMFYLYRPGEMYGNGGGCGRRGLVDVGIFLRNIIWFSRQFQTVSNQANIRCPLSTPERANSAVIGV
jgi:hypothetical protein